MKTHEIRLTNHAMQRANERCDIKSKDKLLRAASTAWRKGTASEDVNYTWLRGLLSSREERTKKEMRLHNGMVYVFAVNGTCLTLVTVYAAPKAYRYYQGQRVVHPKKFFTRLHPEFLV